MSPFCVVLRYRLFKVKEAVPVFSRSRSRVRKHVDRCYVTGRVTRSYKNSLVEVGSQSHTHMYLVSASARHIYYCVVILLLQFSFSLCTWRWCCSVVLFCNLPATPTQNIFSCALSIKRFVWSKFWRQIHKIPSNNVLRVSKHCLLTQFMLGILTKIVTAVSPTAPSGKSTSDFSVT